MKRSTVRMEDGKELGLHVRIGDRTPEEVQNATERYAKKLGGAVIADPILPSAPTQPEQPSFPDTITVVD